MKKTITTLYLACIAGSITAAQTSVRTGSEPKPYNATRSSLFVGFGFAIPDNGSSYYAIIDGSSYCFDAGWRKYMHLNRRFAAGGTLHYSFYSYRLTDALSDSTFKAAATGLATLPGNVNKQLYRSNNFALGVFTRVYLFFAPKRCYVDLGAQGDWAFSRYYMLHYPYPYDGKQKFREDNTFNAFSASAVAQLGWNSVALFARYRLTNVFNQSILSKNLPPLSVGFRLEL